MLSSCDIRKVDSNAAKKTKGSAIPLESHLVKEYRLKFEVFFDNRYTPRKPTTLDLNAYVIPFLQALGFTNYYRGVRYVEMTNDQFATLEAVAAIVLRTRKKRIPTIERRAVTALAAAAVLFTLGHDETERYLDIEKEAIHRFKMDIDHIRILGKDVYSCIMSRFDQYLTCSPITPIQWSRLERKARGFY